MGVTCADCWKVSYSAKRHDKTLNKVEPSYKPIYFNICLFFIFILVYGQNDIYFRQANKSIQ